MIENAGEHLWGWVIQIGTQMPIEVTGGEPQSLEPETEYTGTITGLELRETQEYGVYLDINVDYDELEMDDNPSYKFPEDNELLTPGMDLGKLLERFGITIQPGNDYDLEDILVGERVVFETTSRETEDDFINIDKHSLRPAGGPTDTDTQNTTQNQTTESNDTDEDGEVTYEELAKDIDSRLPMTKAEVLREFAQHNGEFVERFRDDLDRNVFIYDEEDEQVLTYQPQNA